MPNKRGEAISFLMIFFWPGTKYVKVIKQLKLLLKLKNSKLTQEEISAILIIWQYKKEELIFYGVMTLQAKITESVLNKTYWKTMRYVIQYVVINVKHPGTRECKKHLFL